MASYPANGNHLPDPNEGVITLHHHMNPEGMQIENNHALQVSSVRSYDVSTPVPGSNQLTYLLRDRQMAVALNVSSPIQRQLRCQAQENTNLRAYLGQVEDAARAALHDQRTKLQSEAVAYKTHVDYMNSEYQRAARAAFQAQSVIERDAVTEKYQRELADVQEQFNNHWLSVQKDSQQAVERLRNAESALYSELHSALDAQTEKDVRIAVLENEVSSRDVAIQRGQESEKQNSQANQQVWENEKLTLRPQFETDLEGARFQSQQLNNSLHERQRTIERLTHELEKATKDKNDAEQKANQKVFDASMDKEGELALAKREKETLLAETRWEDAWLSPSQDRQVICGKTMRRARSPYRMSAGK